MFKTGLRLQLLLQLAILVRGRNLIQYIHMAQDLPGVFHAFTNFEPLSAYSSYVCKFKLTKIAVLEKNKTGTFRRMVKLSFSSKPRFLESIYSRDQSCLFLAVDY